MESDLIFSTTVLDNIARHLIRPAYFQRNGEQTSKIIRFKVGVFEEKKEEI